MSAAVHGQGVVVRAPGEAARVEDIRIEAPGPGEVRVRVLASGVCHTDLHAKLGHFGRDFPYLLGHEATGEVEAVGAGVTLPRVGDTVMLAWHAPCGRCRACASGEPVMCTATVTAQPRMTTADGKTLGRVLGLGTFATHTVVAAAQTVPVAPGLDPAATCLIGCGVATGVGAVLFAARVEPGSQVAVFGCGGVGLNVVQGARLAHAARIIAVDRVAAKLEWARRFGATDAVLAGAEDPVARIQELCGGGVDYAFDAVGRPEVIAQAAASLGHGGECVLIGLPAPGAELTLSLPKFFYKRCRLRTTFYGDCLPTRDFPLLARWYRDGKLELDDLVSQRIDLGEVEAAFAAMERGDGLRSVIVLPRA
jgi:S-(hydroxymethyl)mycothiol dehydrogenase